MDKTLLNRLVVAGKSTREISKLTDKAQTTVRYWLSKYKLHTRPPRIGLRKWTDHEMAVALENSETIADALEKLGLAKYSGNYTTVRRFVVRTGIDISHMLGAHANRGGIKAKPLSEVLVKNSTYSRGCLKQRLLDSGMLENRCALCGQLPSWNGKVLVLRLDHINGERDDHRPENLRILCPHCDSQLPTFAGRNAKKGRTK